LRYILIILSIIFSFVIFSCGEKEESSTVTTNATTTDNDTTTDNETTTDTTAPVIAEVTPVTTPTSDSTPDYTFSSDEAGTITYGGSCSSSTTSAISGNNTITLTSLSDGSYSDCTIIVKDSAGNASNSLAITSFEMIPSYIAVGSSGTVIKSSDGITWTEVSESASDNSSGLSGTINDITYGNGTYVLVGSAVGDVYSSSNGNSWTSRTSGTSNTLYGVTYAD
jgi:hypothetical protein